MTVPNFDFTPYNPRPSWEQVYPQVTSHEFLEALKRIDELESLVQELWARQPEPERVNGWNEETQSWQIWIEKPGRIEYANGQEPS